MPEPLAVTYLFSRACPSHEEGLQRLHEAARRVNVPVAVEMVEITDDAEAERRRFAGSPTYLVAGADPIATLEGAVFRADACRVYVRAGGRMGPLPDVDDLAAVLGAAAKERA